MIRTLRPLSLLAALTAIAWGQPTLHLTSPEPGRQEIRRGAEGPALLTLLTTETHPRPYIHPLRSPDGKGVLTEFSPGHHKHQTGLYWGPTRINGRDYFHHYDLTYWADRAGDSLVTSDHVVRLGLTSEYLADDGTPVLQGTQSWRLHDHGSYYTLDLDWTGKALVDVTIGKYDYGGLFLRMPWKPGTPAEVLNSEGQKNQAGEGQAAKWVDLAMKIEGMDEMAHVAMIDHPTNPGFPTLWRIDGQFGVGPAIARRGDIRIPKGGSTTYRYRLLVYQGDLDKDLIQKEQGAFYGK